jgi:hypothetical protein
MEHTLTKSVCYFVCDLAGIQTVYISNSTSPPQEETIVSEPQSASIESTELVPFRTCHNKERVQELN